MKRLIICLLLSIKCISFIHAQTAYLVSMQKVYYINLNTFEIYDSAAIILSDDNSYAIAESSDGQVYIKDNAVETGGDSIYVLNPSTKQLTMLCHLTDANPRFDYGLCFDDSNRIVIPGIYPNGSRIAHYNRNTCLIDKFTNDEISMRLGNNVHIVDIIYMNNMYYFADLNNMLFQYNDVNRQLTPIFQLPTTDSNNMRYSSPGLFAVCKGDTTLIYAVLTTDNMIYQRSYLYELNIPAGRGRYVKEYNQILVDAAYYEDLTNFIYLGSDSLYLCPGFEKKLFTNIQNTVWSTGETGPSITVTQPGTYWAKLSNDCGTFTDTIKLDTLYPRVYLPKDTFICGDQYLNLPLNDSVTFQGFTNGGWISSDASIYYGFNKNCNPDLYRYKDTMNVYVVKSGMQIIPINEYIFCRDSITITSRFKETYWSNGSTGKFIRLADTGTYWGALQTPCGIVYDTFRIFKNPEAEFSLGRDTAICANKTITLRGQLDAIWSTGQNGYSITVGPGKYWVTYFGRCSYISDTIIIDSIPERKLEITGDFSICKNEMVTLSSNFSNTYWGGITYGNTYSFKILRDTLLIASVPSACHTYKVYDSVSISALEQPELNISASKINICDTERVWLQASVSPVEWLLPDGTSFRNVSFFTADTGWYKVFYQGSCYQAQDSIQLHYRCDETCKVYLPDAFSPNNDGIQDKFTCFFDCRNLTSFKMSIYNRWGELVFYTQDKQEFWDGNYKNETCASDTYIWIIELDYLQDEQYLHKTQKGTLLLLK